jgi:hypothetical protein
MDRTQLPGPADVTSPAWSTLKMPILAAVLAISVLVILVAAHNAQSFGYDGA